MRLLREAVAPKDLSGAASDRAQFKDAPDQVMSGKVIRLTPSISTPGESSANISKLQPFAFTACKVAISAVLVACIALVAGALCQLVGIQGVRADSFHVGLGLVVALIYSLSLITVKEPIAKYRKPLLFHLCKCADRWAAALVIVFLVAVVTIGNMHLQVAWFILFGIFGLAGVIGLEAGSIRLKVWAIDRGLLPPLRRVVIGRPSSITTFSESEFASTLIGGWIAAFVYPDAIFAKGSRRDVTLKIAKSFAKAAANLQADEIIILTEPESEPVDRQLLAELSTVSTQLRFLSPSKPESFDAISVASMTVGSGCLVSIRPYDDFGMLAKRSFDIVFAGIGLILTAPVLGAASLAIYLEQKGPVFFRQYRGGRDHGKFLIWKLRTMKEAGEQGEVRQAQPNDPRVTRVGSWLRKLNIDELPQLWNVVCGQMSLVGPRPHALVHDENFAKIVDCYNQRYLVRPGITGWAQILGFRGTINTDYDIEARLGCDIEYIRNWSLALDMYIIIMTVISRRGYQNAV
ncbi:MAG: exopolysaccharide biosynthesis polyprenyl glycosylphosphotransferase [Hyphomicrobiaceae bacterium]